MRKRAFFDADVVVGQYAYYADNRRASKTVTHRGELDGTTYFFYDGLREIEERSGSEAVTQQYVWGHEYIDQLLMIRGANGTWFAHQDANWNVIALTTPSGDVAEEYQYQPYGLPLVKRHLAYGDSDADGDVDSTDNTAHFTALTTYNRKFDANFDGDVGNNVGDPDRDAWDNAYNDPAASTTMVVANRGFSPTGNPFLFTGRRLDAETGLYYYRFRTYHPTLKQFIQRDPLGYGASGPSLYQYVGGMPTSAVDPLGLIPPFIDWDDPEPVPKPGTENSGLSKNDHDDCVLRRWKKGRDSLDDIHLGSGQTTIATEEAVRTVTVVAGVVSPLDEMLLIGALARLGAKGSVVGGKWVIRVAGKILDERKAASLLKKAKQAADESKTLLDEVLSKAKVPYTEGQLKAYRRQLAEKGVKSLNSSKETLLQKIKEHLENLQDYRRNGGHTSYVEGEIINFQGQINAIDKILGELP